MIYTCNNMSKWPIDSLETSIAPWNVSLLPTLRASGGNNGATNLFHWFITVGKSTGVCMLSHWQSLARHLNGTDPSLILFVVQLCFSCCDKSKEQLRRQVDDHKASQARSGHVVVRRGERWYWPRYDDNMFYLCDWWISEQQYEVEHSQSVDFETCPGVVSQGGGGCDIELKTLAIFLSPVCGEFRNSSCFALCDFSNKTLYVSFLAQLSFSHILFSLSLPPPFLPSLKKGFV